MWFNRDQLRFQYQWRGAALLNTYILVCQRCLDIPTDQNRAIVLPADPVPVFYPSVEDFAAAETDYRVISQPTVTDARSGIPIPSTTLRVTEDCENRTLNPLGQPIGVVQNGVMPAFTGGVTYGRELAVLSVVSNGTPAVSVTCSVMHGLQNSSQVSIAGLSVRDACGLFNVTVVTATAFSYQPVPLIPSQNLLTPTTRIITANVGAPIGYERLPLPGKITFTPVPPPPPIGVYLMTDDGQFLTTDSGVPLIVDTPPTNLQTDDGDDLQTDGGIDILT